MAIKTESYGKNYRRARLRAGLTQVQVAEALGIDQRVVSNHETDASEPSNSLLKRMAILYRTSTDELLEMPSDGDGASLDAPGDGDGGNTPYSGDGATPGYLRLHDGPLSPFPLFQAA
jgi:transcriptional regulator with XRE-family HTH domain